MTKVTIRHAIYMGGPLDSIEHPIFEIEPGEKHRCRGDEYTIRRTKNLAGRNVTLLVHPDALGLFKDDE